MKHTFSRSFATRLSIYVLSFTLIIFATIMALFYYYKYRILPLNALMDY